MIRSKSPSFFNKNGQVIKRRILGDYVDFEKHLLDDKKLISAEEKAKFEALQNIFSNNSERCASLEKATKQSNLTAKLKEYDSLLKKTLQKNLRRKQENQKDKVILDIRNFKLK